MKRKRCFVALIVVLSLLFNGVFEISSYATALDDDGEKGFFDSSREMGDDISDEFETNYVENDLFVDGVRDVNGWRQENGDGDTMLMVVMLQAGVRLMESGIILILPAI